MAQSIRSRYREHSGEERAEHGYHKPKSRKKAFKAFKEKKERKPKDKVEKVMHEFKEGTLHSGSKKGPKVSSRKQALAIALSEARKSGEHVKPYKKSARAKKAKTIMRKRKK